MTTKKIKPEKAHIPVPYKLIPHLDEIRRMYTDGVPYRDLCGHFSVSTATMLKALKMLEKEGLKLRGKQGCAWKSYDPERQQDVRRRISESNRRTYREEYRRVVIFGLPPKTRRRISCQTQHKRITRFRFRAWGYIEDPDDHNLFYWPSESIRRPRSEERFTKRFGLKFRPLDNRN